MRFQLLIASTFVWLIGGTVFAADLVVSGEVTRVSCAVRPRGHQAERDAAMGFCFFNNDNVAVGICHAQRHHGISRLAPVDFDVHHGSGSEDILAGGDRVLMVSTFQLPLYSWLGEMPKGAKIVNVPLAPHTREDALKKVVEECWLPAPEAFRPKIIFISAGFDAFRDDDMANLDCGKPTTRG